MVLMQYHCPPAGVSVIFNAVLFAPLLSSPAGALTTYFYRGPCRGHWTRRTAASRLLLTAAAQRPPSLKLLKPHVLPLVPRFFLITPMMEG